MWPGGRMRHDGKSAMKTLIDLPEFMQRESVSMLVGSVDTQCIVAYPENTGHCREALDFFRSNGLTVCPRGSGRSYGDAILNDRQALLDMSRMNRIISFDADSGRVTVEAGTRIIDILLAYHHLGFTVPASPTDSTISVGGAMGANVNGKESWRVGNFGDQIVSFTLLIASGEIIAVDRDSDPQLFFAVIGGMGLLGVVLEVTVQMIKVPSPFLGVSISAADNLDALIAQLEEVKESADFVVVWIDTYASGVKLGRSVIHATRWLSGDVDEASLRETIRGGVELLAVQKSRAIRFFSAFRFFINLGFQFQKIPIRLFNNFYFNLYKKKGDDGQADAVVSDPELFLEHNFDKSYTVPPPDILCGPDGYTVQLTVPHRCGREAMKEILELCQRMPCPPATTILRLHRKDDHLISFSEDGYSLNVEFHPKRRHRKVMRERVGEMIDCAIRYGGKIHLPKDSVLTREQFRQIYPGYLEFTEIKQRLDPAELFQSDMYRRLFVDPPATGVRADNAG
jgi:decaprenylphospho-beta-D-ribofuranose 2-oxidase